MAFSASLHELIASVHGIQCIRMSWVFIVVTVIVTDYLFFTTIHCGVVCPHLVGDSPV